MRRRDKAASPDPRVHKPASSKAADAADVPAAAERQWVHASRYENNAGHMPGVPRPSPFALQIVCLTRFPTSLVLELFPVPQHCFFLLLLFRGRAAWCYRRKPRMTATFPFFFSRGRI